MKIHYKIINVPEKVIVRRNGKKIERYPAHTCVSVQSPHTIWNLRSMMLKKERKGALRQKAEMLKHGNGKIHGGTGRPRGVSHVDNDENHVKPTFFQRMLGHAKNFFLRKT